MSIFFLEAYETVRKSKIAEYEKMSHDTDAKVKDTEPGMLVHAQSKISESDDEVVYRWLEVFESYEAFETHLNNPCVQEHVKKFTDHDILSGPVDVQIHCDWTDAQKAACLKIPGLELTFVPLVNGYFR